MSRILTGKNKRYFILTTSAIGKADARDLQSIKNGSDSVVSFRHGS
jgi:hypothetical protein